MIIWLTAMTWYENYLIKTTNFPIIIIIFISIHLRAEINSPTKWQIDNYCSEHECVYQRLLSNLYCRRPIKPMDSHSPRISLCDDDDDFYDCNSGGILCHHICEIFFWWVATFSIRQQFLLWGVNNNRAIAIGSEWVRRESFYRLTVNKWAY